MVDGLVAIRVFHAYRHPGSPGRLPLRFIMHRSLRPHRNNEASGTTNRRDEPFRLAVRRERSHRSRRSSLRARPFRGLVATVLAGSVVAGLTLWAPTSAVAGSGVANPSFESGWSSSTKATCWQQGEIGNGIATLVASSTAHAGSVSAKLTITGLSSGGSRNVVIDQHSASCAPTVLAGHRYALSAWYRASAAVRMVVYYRDSAGTWHWWAQSPRWGSRNAWRAMSFVTAAVPSGATALSFGPSLSSKGWLLVDDAGMADTTTPTPTPTPTRWVPAVGAAWQIQYTGPLDTSVNVPAYNLDGFDTAASTVTALRDAGRHGICYFSAGSWENWRPDAGSYPSSVLGSSNGWPGEKWVDIRQISVLKPIIDSRLAMCASKGFEAVDPDNVDGYANNSGFPLTAANQLAFNRMVATEAHAYGMSVGLKNDLDQIPDLVGNFDFAVNEQCFQYQECGTLSPFISAGKAVLHIEYKGDPSQICPISRSSGFSTLFKNLSLDLWRQAC